MDNLLTRWRRRALCALLVLGVLAVMSGTASAGTLSFYNISNNTGQAVQVAAQLTVEYVSVDANTVSFTFRNVGNIASSVCDVYFDDSNLLAEPVLITEGPGVQFSQNATPKDLPGGNTLTPKFEATEGFTADSDSPSVSENGVANFTGSGDQEWVTLTIDLQPGKTFADVEADILSGALRIGLHVQAIGTSGGSDTFVNNPEPLPPPGPTPVPEPSTIALALSGVLSLGLGALRRSRRATV